MAQNRESNYPDGPIRLALIRRTKKPLPQQLSYWRREVEGCFGFINRPIDDFPKASQQWYDTMRQYYMDRLYDLMAFHPTQLMATEELKTVLRKGVSCLRYFRML